ncbi:DUF6192 family protein [Streptomyces sp. NRRL S-1448]|uniref:DUF6192 family protein n=1 Tax=Streptomyces sp. NRRL S-1448 TaxID=1463883 RepID=UPI0004C251CB|nr:DUF6192 family protein [Streptomyces sp. NRRL S-1448]
MPRLLSAAGAAAGPFFLTAGLAQGLTRDGFDFIPNALSPGCPPVPAVWGAAAARRVRHLDTARMLVNRAQFDNSEETRERIRERIPAVRKIEHTIEYLDLVTW